MAVAVNSGTKELAEVTANTATNQINVSSGGMAIIGSNNVIHANEIKCVNYLQQQPKIPNDTDSGECLPHLKTVRLQTASAL